MFGTRPRQIMGYILLNRVQVFRMKYFEKPYRGTVRRCQPPSNASETQSLEVIFLTVIWVFLLTQFWQHYNTFVYLQGEFTLTTVV